MRETDKQAAQASKDINMLDLFIKKHELFILKCASTTTKKHISKSDDEWSIALSAFSEAVSKYSYDEGSFLSFANVVIRRRLIDYFRSETRRNSEILVNPVIFSSGTTEDESSNIAIKKEVESKAVNTTENALKDEINAVTEQLNKYGFSFYDLISCSPKAEKTKKACAKACLFVMKNSILLGELRNSKMLPIKIISEKTGVPRKNLERHRKYIIAAIEILTGDYPYLAEYMSFIRREDCK